MLMRQITDNLPEPKNEQDAFDEYMKNKRKVPE